MKSNHEEHDGQKEKIKKRPYDFFVNFVSFVVQQIFS